MMNSQTPTQIKGYVFFSQNDDKAWAEKCFLIYSPVWMAIMAIVMLTGLHYKLNDTGFLLLALVVMAPNLLLPMLFNPNPLGIKWYNTYWFKSNIYIASFSFFGNYVGSEYFFDVLGMVYHFDTITTHLDAYLIGKGEQKVPLIMYLLTHSYFMTYHVTAVIALRLIRSINAKFHSTLLFLIAAFVIGYCWAWAETKAMANPLIEQLFYYNKMDTMLAYGSAIYAIYFVASFPIFYCIDESPEKPWPLLQVISASFSASMLTLYGLDAAAHFIGVL